MRVRIAAALVCLSLTALPALAQSQSTKEAKHQSGTIKTWVGVGLLVIGGSMAATSHASASTTVQGLGSIDSSTTSTSQLVAGLGMLGGGGYLLWNGLNERKEADSMPSTSVAVSVGKRSGIFIRRTW
jgi:hypothetical protein